MSYARNAAPTTTTKDGTPATPTFDYTTKTVSVSIGGAYVGTWKNWEAAKQELGLVDVKGKRE